MITFNFDKILFIGAHFDDIEIGCGATLVNFLEKGSEVFYFVLSSINLKLIAEAKKSIEKLGLNENRLLYYDYPRRKLSEVRQNILDDMIELRDKIFTPDAVFVPCRSDIHQDHQTVTNEAIRIFKNVSIFGYEQVWNNISFDAEAFVRITEQQLQQKLAAIKCYKSQTYRKYIDSNFIRALAKVRGTQIGVDYAECFEVIRMVMR